MKTRNNITLKDILASVKETQILCHYLGYYTIKGNIYSPFRAEKSPSFNIGLFNETVRFKDYGSAGENGNLYDLLGKIYNKTYLEVIDMIYLDLEKIKKSPETIFSDKVKTIITQKGVRIKKNPIEDIKFIVRPWQKHDEEFWNQFGITVEFLTMCNNYAISHIVLIQQGEEKIIPAEKYAYAYVEFKDGKQSVKIYQPYSIEHKWSNKHDPSVWDLWNKLPPKGKYLIITSSRKDAMCIWKNSGIPSTSLQAESYLPKSQVIEELKSRFEHIVIWYDNDFDKSTNWGKQFAEKLSKEFNIPNFIIPEIYIAKDPSDFYKKYKKQAFLKLIKNLLKN